jgi:hypothetical protein
VQSNFVNGQCYLWCTLSCYIRMFSLYVYSMMQLQYVNPPPDHYSAYYLIPLHIYWFPWLTVPFPSISMSFLWIIQPFKTIVLDWFGGKCRDRVNESGIWVTKSGEGVRPFFDLAVCPAIHMCNKNWAINKVTLWFHVKTPST